MNLEFKIILTIFIFFEIILIFFVLFCLIKYLRYRLKYNKINKFLYNYLSKITSARYGNLNIKIEKGVNSLTRQLSNNTNALFESIIDRDKMINEYIEKEHQHQNIQKDFIASLAHDLKVPIIAQDNTYDLFLNNSFGEISANQKQVIKNLKISNNDLKNLVINLLDIQKLDIEDFALEKENLDLIQFIKSVIEQNQSILTIKNKKIEFICNDNSIFYNFDKMLFKRLLNNLIANAIYYGKNSSLITIKLNKSAKNIEISVIDEGDGIKEEDINKIFKKYYSNSKKYSNLGIGLGLYIANKIVLAHDGKISAKNNTPKGAIFKISLPLQS